MYKSYGRILKDIQAKKILGKFEKLDLKLKTDLNLSVCFSANDLGICLEH